ncbi:hypothetical protein [Stenotrophomonas sp. PS02298]|uniref:hypothetical protein n=1 Tax=Stenotrophomonas sp. PS02298 TaxID=2991424 RepID=UPI00249A2D3F|nr:hypothetical protein [Stenotrophomonas sp. PS02298]
MSSGVRRFPTAVGLLLFTSLAQASLGHVSFDPGVSTASTIDPSMYCPSPGIDDGVCQANARFWAEQHERLLGDALRRVADVGALQQDESAWLAAIERECRNELECLGNALIQRHIHLDGIVKQEEATATAIQTDAAATDDQAYASDDVEAQVIDEEQEAALAPTRLATKPRADTNAAADDVTPTQPVPSTATKSQITPAGKAMLLLVLASALLCCIVLALSAFGKIVFYYDVRDFGWSLSPALFTTLALCSVAVLRSGELDSAPLNPTQITVLAVGAVAALAGVLIAYRNAIRYNRSLFVGLLVGSGKAFVAAFMIFSFLANASRRNSENYYRYNAKGRRERALAASSFTVLGLLWYALVNGERVYQRKGWDPP